MYVETRISNEPRLFYGPLYLSRPPYWSSQIQSVNTWEQVDSASAIVVIRMYEYLYLQ